MHAASVHPEPGSNSRKICINTTYTAVPIFFRACSALIYSLEFLLQKNFEIRIFALTLLCTYLCCSIFKDQCRLTFPSRQAFRLTAPFPCDLYILPLPLPFVKPFSKVFSTFFALSKLASIARYPVFRDSFIRLPHPLHFVNPFFESFLRFFQKTSAPPKHSVLLTAP